MERIQFNLDDGTLQRGILQWKKRIGEEVLPGEVVCTIEMMTIIVELIASEGGTVRKIYTEDGQ